MNDLDILIPLYIDHPDRLDNCLNVVNILHKYNYKNIFVNEYYIDNPKAESVINSGVVYQKKKINDNFFNKMQCINELFKTCNSQYLTIYDVDVIVLKKDLVESIKMLENGFDFVYPYNGKFFNVPKNKIQSFIETGSIGLNECNLFHPNSCGGCVIFKREVFEKAGKCNPNFKNVGFDDDEIKTRFLKLGYKMGRTNSPLFHLEHERTHTSYGISKFDRYNQNEYYRICNMDKEKLIQEISSWSDATP
jgi:hypothetical protein